MTTPLAGLHNDGVRPYSFIIQANFLDRLIGSYSRFYTTKTFKSYLFKGDYKMLFFGRSSLFLDQWPCCQIWVVWPVLLAIKALKFYFGIYFTGFQERILIYKK